MEQEESTSVFIEYFGDSPHIRILDFLLEGQDFDYSMTEVARGAHVGWSSFTRVWEHLLMKEIIVQTRIIGNAKLFKLNKKNLIVQRMMKLDWELSKLAAEHVHKEEHVSVK